MKLENIKRAWYQIQINIQVCVEYIALAVMLACLGSYSIVIIACTYIFNWIDLVVQYIGKLLRIRK
jgi:hypothetical protein